MAFNLLITSAGGIRTSDLIYQIKKKSIYNPIKIYTTDTRKNFKNKHLADSFTQVSQPWEKNYIKKIVNIIKKNSIKLVIPRSDEEAIRLSKKKENKLLMKWGL